MNWCKGASIKNANTRKDAAENIKDRCLIVIEEYMEMYYIKETEQQKTTYQGQGLKQIKQIRYRSANSK